MKVSAELQYTITMNGSDAEKLMYALDVALRNYHEDEFDHSCVDTVNKLRDCLVAEIES